MYQKFKKNAKRIWIVKIIYKKYFKVILLLNDLKFTNSAAKIEKYRNKHKGEKCFIIGNGPSLNIDDLELIKNEITFGTHRIYNLFEKTQWRPSYYCAQDSKLIIKSFKEINNINVIEKFIVLREDHKYPKLKNSLFLKMLFCDFYPSLPKLSKDLKLGTYEGFSVTYACLQIAFYMGFSEIALLGMDNNYSEELNPDGTIKYNKNTQNHFSKEDLIENTPQIFKTNCAYEKAKLYANSNGVKIYNATRGGSLEIFERKKLENTLDKI